MERARFNGGTVSVCAAASRVCDARRVGLYVCSALATPVAVGVLRPRIYLPADLSLIHILQGLSPAISIDQKTTSRNPRSTVGTVTEIYDYLRLMLSLIHIWSQ